MSTSFGPSSAPFTPRRFSRRGFLATVPVAALGAGLLGGCSTTPQGAAGASSGSTGGALTYWSMWKQGEPQQKVLDAAISAFKASTGISVDVQWQGRDVLKKLLPTLTGNSVPDLVDQEAGPVQSSLVSLEQARDLTDAYAEPIPGEDGATVGSVIPERYRTLTTSGKTQFMVPYELISSAFWFDGHRLADVAAQPPTDWASFAQLLAKRKAAGESPLAVDGDISFYNSYYTVYGLLRVLGVGGVNALVADKKGAGWDDPRVLDVGTKIESLVKNDYFIKGYDGSKYPAIEQRWATGAADFYYAGTWTPSETSSYQADGFVVDSFQFPSFGGPGDGSVETGMLGFAVPSKAKNYEQAKKFMAFVLAKQNLSGIATVAQNLTPRDDIPAPKELESVQKALQAAPSVHRPYDGIDADFANYTPSVFEPVNTKLLFGQIGAQAWVEQLKADTIRYWKQNS
jgi:ABC-type glycerol-3-phosphate transport system substrate-binding protein